MSTTALLTVVYSIAHVSSALEAFIRAVTFKYSVESPMFQRLTQLFVFFVITVSAYRKYRSQIPNGSNVPNVRALGHVKRGGGGARNPFGEDFSDNDGDWQALCKLDSDGDGLTNGQELGDPCCQWTEQKPTSLITDGLSHPGEASSKTTNPALVNPNCNSKTTQPESPSQPEQGTKDEETTNDKNVKDTQDQKNAASTSSLVSGAFLIVSLFVVHFN